MIRHLAIVGTGLVGASVGLAAKRAGVESVAAFDADAEALALAGERGAIDVAASSVAEAVAGADLAVLAVPVGDLPARIGEVLAAAPEGAIVTDVGSTKGAACAAAAGDGRFIGGHPMAGGEARGPANAKAELFEGATWFLTPVAATDPGRYRTLHGFVASLGAVPVAVDPTAHDRLVALTSHFPHALANLLLNQVGVSKVDGHDALLAGGGALRDMTRVAGANPRMWVDIFLENADALEASLAEHRRRVEQLEAAVAARDAGFLARWIGEAAGHRRRMLSTAFADPVGLQRLTVHLSDRPGVLAGIFHALGAERINVEDFEMHHVSPERGGELTVLVTGEAEAQRAAAVLEAQGYGVVVQPELDA